MKTAAALGLIALITHPAFGQNQGLLGAEIVQGGQMADGRPLAALVLTLAPDWKTYWRSPGEGGLPPQFDWSASQNLGEVALYWPTPQVLDVGGLINIGYSAQLVLPLAISPKDPSLPVDLTAQIALGICKDICVPIHVDVNAIIQPNAPPLPMIKAALANQPMPADAAGVLACASQTTAIKDGVRLQLQVTMPPWPDVGPEIMVVEHRDAAIWVSGAQVGRQGDVLSASVDLVPVQAKPFDLNPADLRITVLNGVAATEWLGCGAAP